MTQIPASSTLLDDHGNLITWALRRLNVPPDHREDARQGGALGLLVALDRFDPERGNYRSFAGSHVLHEVRTASGMTRRQEVHQVELQHDLRHARLGYIDDGIEDVERGDALAAARRFLHDLAGEDADIAERIYVDGATQTEVAAELGTYKMAVSRRVAAIESRAREDLTRFADAE